jgi:hypothetical protein
MRTRKDVLTVNIYPSMANPTFLDTFDDAYDRNKMEVVGNYVLASIIFTLL